MLKEKLENIIQEIYQPIKDIIDDKNSKKYFALLVIIYLIGYASIIKANVYYMDDWVRALGGGHWNQDKRYLSTILSKILHMGWRLSDISPLTQIIAVLFLSSSSILLVKIINGRLRFVPIIASACIGLFPYFLENISFKFDSPYMAFSILSSIVPFLWYRSKKIYFVAFSTLGVLATLLTYQAASGVYIIIFISIISKDFLQKNKTYKQIFITTTFAVFGYGLALLVYRYLFLGGGTYTYLKTSVFPFSELPMGVLYNLKEYWLMMKQDWARSFIGYASLFLSLLYIVKLRLLSKQNKVLSFVIAIMSLAITSLFLWGILIALTKVNFTPRMYIGVGVFVAVLAITELKTTSRVLQRVNRLFIGVFVYALLVFANAFGNAQKAQDELDTFRLKMVMRDVSRYLPSTKENVIICFDRQMDYSKVVINASHHYPLMKRLVKLKWKYSALIYYGFPTERGRISRPICKKEVAKNTLLSTAFHTIEKAKDSDCYFVTFK